GVNVPAIWNLLIRQTRSRKANPHPQLARLYAVSTAGSPKKGRPSGRKVWLLDDDVPLLDNVRLAIMADEHYRRPESQRLLLADDDAPALPVRQDVCAEVGYNVVNLNPWSRSAISILEGAWVRFYVNRFREDYEAGDEFLKTQPRPCTR